MVVYRSANIVLIVAVLVVAYISERLIAGLKFPVIVPLNGHLDRGDANCQLTLGLQPIKHTGVLSHLGSLKIM